jgi:hypothetical protein
MSYEFVGVPPMDDHPSTYRLYPYYMRYLRSLIHEAEATKTELTEKELGLSNIDTKIAELELEISIWDEIFDRSERYRQCEPIAHSDTDYEDDDQTES